MDNHDISQDSKEVKKTLDEEIAEYSPAAAEGKIWAIYNLAQAHFDEAARTNKKKYYKKAYEYFKQAADLGDAESCYHLAYMISEGLGVRSSSADMVHYFKLYLERFDDKCEDGRGGANTQLSWQYAIGDGTVKNLPLAYEYAKKGTEYNDCADSQAWFDNLKSTYPFTENGEIDISVRKRTGLTTFLLWIGILGCIWGLVIPNLFPDMNEKLGGPAFFVGMAINLAAYAGVLFWQKWGGWLLIAKLVIWPFTAIVFYGTMKSGYTELVFSPFEQFCMAFFADPLLVILILCMLQRRKAGYALPWCSLMDTRDDGRSLFTKVKDFVMVYGEGEAYRMHSVQSKTFIYCCYVCTAMVAAFGAYCAYKYFIADIDWSMNIEWRCWENSGLWIFLSVIGFFFQFFDWQHFSYKEGWLVDDGGNKKFVPNNDILSVTEGGIIWPLIIHLFVAPAVYGAMFYYIIMGALALLGTALPYAVGILCIAYAAVFYKMAKHLYARRWRVPLLILWGIFSALFLLAIASPALSSNTKSQIGSIKTSDNSASVDYTQTYDGNVYESTEGEQTYADTLAADSAAIVDINENQYAEITVYDQKVISQITKNWLACLQSQSIGYDSYFADNMSFFVDETIDYRVANPSKEELNKYLELIHNNNENNIYFSLEDDIVFITKKTVGSDGNFLYDATFTINKQVGDAETKYRVQATYNNDFNFISMAIQNYN